MPVATRLRYLYTVRVNSPISSRYQYRHSKMTIGRTNCNCNVHETKHAPDRHYTPWSSPWSGRFGELAGASTGTPLPIGGGGVVRETRGDLAASGRISAAELSVELTRKTMSPCAREHLLDGRAARLGTIPLCGALGSLRFSRRVPTTERDGADDGDERGTREVSALTLVRGHVRHIRSGELARRRSRSATPNDHRSATRHSISRTCANCPNQPTDTDGHCPTALTTVRHEPTWPRQGLGIFLRLLPLISECVPKSVGAVPKVLDLSVSLNQSES